jgi:Flp pilus assembly protein TadG
MKQRRQKGQSLVEFAFALPVFMMIVFVTIELSLLLVSYYSETRVARESARWLAVHSAATNDNEFADHVVIAMLPGLVKGPWAANAHTNGTAVLPSSYKVGNMNMEFTSCMPNLDVNNGAGTGVCTNPNRVAGSTLYVQMSYDAAGLFFLSQPVWRMGSLTVHLPTTLPIYKVSVMVE